MKYPVVNRKKLETFIKECVLAESTSWDLEDFVDELPRDNEAACEKFCRKYDLGDWFYEAMILNDIEIDDLLLRKTVELKKQEKEAEKEMIEQENDYRSIQGYF